MIKVAVGKDLGVAQTREIEWNRFATALTTHTRSNRKGGKFFVGGYFEGTERKEDAMVARTLLTLDIDDVQMSIEGLELHLLMNIDCAFCAYSTYSHTPEKPRIRVVIPLNQEITPNQYRDISHRFGDDLGLPLDACSYKPNQVMYMPSCPDTAIAWSINQDGDAYQVEPALALVPSTEVVQDTGDADDLEAMIAEQPLDLTDEEIDGWLLAGPAQGLDYDAWLMRGAALNHQYQGSKAGFDKWLEWSKKSDKHDDAQMKTKWRSFGRSSRVVTFASVIFAVKEAGGFDAPEAADTFEAMLDEAEAIETLDEYRDFKERITKLSTVVLHDDHRSMIAARIAKTFGKEQGITKGDIKKALAPRRRQREAEGDVDVPVWLEQWVYCESTLEFINIELDYAIKREGFNAKYDRETECVIAEMSAAQYALIVVKIQTVVDVMFWPGVGQLFEHEGKTMLNKYRDRGVDVAEPSDDSDVVARFLRHLELTLPDADDREIFLDWLCFVCQNPGLRVNWALLLQGSQGTGKTYFVNVLQAVLGRNVANLDPQAIAGRFTAWAHGSTVVAIEEIRIHGTNKFEILDRMKPFLTNDTVSIEEKGRDHRTVPNFTSYLLLTNHSDAIPLADGDRRYCVLYSHWQSEGQMFDELGGRSGAEKYFDALFDDLHESRVGELAWFLKTRKLSDRFSPRGRAPETKARQAMINLAISPERQLLEDALAEHECAVINDEILDVTWLNELCKMSETELPKTRAMTAILLEMGFTQYEKRYLKISKDMKNHYLWFGHNTNADIATKTVRDFHNDSDFIPF